MKTLAKFAYRYGSIQQSPADRITSSRIVTNIREHELTYQFVNNVKIAYDCTKIAIKYSKCYLCQVPLLRYPLQRMYNMEKQDEILDKVQQLFLDQCPIPKFRGIFRRFDYENKGIYAALALIKQQQLTQLQQQSAIKFLTALELVNLGFSLHHSVGSTFLNKLESHRLNFATRMALKMMSKQMKDSYLVLGGDYFHIKGSVLASKTNNIRLSELLSEVQIDMCKYVHLTQKLKNKIMDSGYDKVDIQEIYNISVLKTSAVIKGLTAIDIITGKQQTKKMKQVYEIVGLLMLYRRNLESFMFNFKTIVKKYLEYSENRINFDTEESLPYYIFFQGAQKQRIDTSYLNTVAMMSEEIKYLQNKLSEILGEKQAKEWESKMGYYLMMYS